ncbi:MAG: helical backbone metal receptor [Burkholderiaceae bacterium]
MAPRIVSLVPSLTELVCSLGLGTYLVGRTGFCVHPREQVRQVPKVGGTKAVDVERIRQLKPTHLIVSREENEQPVVAELASFIPEIIVTNPITLTDNLGLYRQFGDQFDRRDEANRLVEQFEQAHARLLSRQDHPVRVLYLIWKSPWMTVTRNTFISQMLACVGFKSVPDIQGERDADRYPVVADNDWSDWQPSLVLMSSEPFRFGPQHFDDVRQMPGMSDTPCRLIDGEMTSWYGPRAIAGLHYLAGFRDALNHSFELQRG